MKLKLIFSLFLTASLVVIGYIVFSFKMDYSDERTKILDSLHQEKTKIETFLLETEKVAQSICTEIANTDDHDLKAILQEVIESNPNIFKIRIAFMPKAYHDKPFYAIDIKRHGSEFLFHNIDFNYTKKTSQFDTLNSNWYHLAIQNGATWNEPRKEYGTSDYIIDYSIPFKIGNQEKAFYDGVVSVSVSLDVIHNFVETLKFKNTGYAVLLSPKGRFLYHPKKELVRDTSGAFGLAKQKMALSKKGEALYKNAERLIDIVTKSLKGEYGCRDYTSIITYQKMKFCYKPLYNGWSLHSLCLEKEFMSFFKDYKKRFYWVTLLLMITLCLATLAFIKQNSWSKSFIISGLLSLGIISIWIINYQFPKENSQKEIVIGDYEGLQTFINKYKEQSGSEATFIPTGVFIQSLEFSSANNIKITGYIWQHYQINDTITNRGFVLPEAEDLTVEVAYEKIQEDMQTIGWYFTTTIRERFDYANFPFDREKLWIRLWHKDFDKNIVLIPDVNSYDVINPTFKPGIEKDFVLSGWNIKGSHFSYTFNSYNTNFGIKDYVGQTDFPELYFNIDLSRVFINPFISHLIPLLVVLLMLFSILQVGKKNDKKGLFGFSSLAAVSACSALFFVIIFNHINIRNSLSVSGIVYFEWFYIISYVAIMYVSISAILIAQEDGVRLFQYKDNFYSRILFGPVILALSFVITFFHFY